MVTVEELGTNKFSYVFVVEEQSPDKANIPEDILSLPASSEKRALIGSALIRRGEYWKLQGYSMIYSAACSVPYAAIIAKEYYGFKNIDEVCAEPAKN
jgi:hypothetical protein